MFFFDKTVWGGDFARKKVQNKISTRFLKWFLVQLAVSLIHTHIWTSHCFFFFIQLSITLVSDGPWWKQPMEWLADAWCELCRSAVFHSLPSWWQCEKRKCELAQRLAAWLHWNNSPPLPLHPLHNYWVSMFRRVVICAYVAELFLFFPHSHTVLPLRSIVWELLPPPLHPL